MNFFMFLILVLNISEYTNAEQVDDGNWTCNNCETIDREALCDGSKDCSDGSDEIIDNCMRTCLTNEYRCNYGGCITLYKKCDGKGDCADESDEIPELCKKKTFGQLSKERQGECEEGYISCDSTCVDIDAACDAQADCIDGRDEESALCSLRECVSSEFKCANGACIPNSKKCNGSKDCVDGSDEATSMCQYRRKMCEKMPPPTFPLRPTFEPALTFVLPLPPDTSPRKSSNCDIPQAKHLIAENLNNQRLNAGFIGHSGTVIQVRCDDNFEWKNSDPFKIKKIKCNQSGWNQTVTECVPVAKECRIPYDPNLKSLNLNTDEVLTENSLVYNNDCVSFSCAEGYRFAENFTKIEVLCVNKTWQNSIPKCVPLYCNESFLTRGYSTKASCMFGGAEKECKKILPGYRAHIYCASGFQRPRTHKENYLECSEERKWLGTKSACKLDVCGEAEPSRVGENFNISEAPWHVGVYRDFRSVEAKWVRRCSGTILTPKLVLSAIHCFWDNANYIPFDVTYYTLIAGTAKQLENLDVQHNTEQRADPLRFIYDARYNTDTTKYSYDIAIVVLAKAFQVSSAVKPICIDFREELQKTISSGTNLTVASWVENQSNNVIELRKVTLRSMDIRNCERKIRTQLNNAYKFKPDEICSENVYNSMVKPGDSGAGLIEEVDKDGRIRHNVEGVISLSPVKNNNIFITATSIQSYRKLIEDAQNEYEERDENDN